MGNPVSRQELNRSILRLLLAMNEECPDMRLGQLLINCGITVDTANKSGDLPPGTFVAPRNEVLWNEESASIGQRVMICVGQMRAQQKGQVNEIKNNDESKSAKKTRIRNK